LHLAQPPDKILKIPRPECHNCGIHGIVAELQPFGFTGPESDNGLAPFPRNFGPSDGEHMLCDIDADNFPWMKAKRRNGEIGGAGGDIKDAVGRNVAEAVDRLASPVEVNPSAKHMIQKIVPVGDGVEERAYVSLFQSCRRAVVIVPSKIRNLQFTSNASASSPVVHLRSSIFHPRSSIFHPRSSILDLPSSIFHPRSSILDLRSSILDLSSSIQNSEIRIPNSSFP